MTTRHRTLLRAAAKARCSPYLVSSRQICFDCTMAQSDIQSSSPATPSRASAGPNESTAASSFKLQSFSFGEDV